MPAESAPDTVTTGTDATGTDATRTDATRTDATRTDATGTTGTTGTGADPARVMLSPEGPLLVHGPVRVELPDGRRIDSDRPVTALCGCRRSRRYPFCDASHRTKTRPHREDR